MATEKFTAQQVADALRATKGLISLAAKRLECDPGTVRNYAARYASVQAAMREERAAFVDVAEAKLMQAVQNGEAWAIALVLKTLGKERGYVERHEFDFAGIIEHMAAEYGVPAPAVVNEVQRILAEARR